MSTHCWGLPMVCCERCWAWVWASLLHDPSPAAVQSPWTCPQSRSTWEEWLGLPAQPGGVARLLLSGGDCLHCPPTQQGHLQAMQSLKHFLDSAEVSAQLVPEALDAWTPLKQADKGNGARSSVNSAGYMPKNCFIYKQAKSLDGK